MIAFRQVMSYEMLRIVMIGYAKLKIEKIIYHNFCDSKIITVSASDLHNS